MPAGVRHEGIPVADRKAEEAIYGARRIARAARTDGHRTDRHAQRMVYDGINFAACGLFAAPARRSLSAAFLRHDDCDPHPRYAASPRSVSPGEARKMKI